MLPAEDADNQFNSLPGKVSGSCQFRNTFSSSVIFLWLNNFVLLQISFYFALTGKVRRAFYAGKSSFRHIMDRHTSLCYDMDDLKHRNKLN